MGGTRIQVCVLGTVLVLLAGCQTVPAGGDFFVKEEGGKLTPQGTGWQPGHVIRFWLYDQPVSDADNPGSYSCVTAPQELKFEPETPLFTVDPNGMFGYSGSPRYWLVQKKVCGAAPTNKCKPRIQAQDQSTKASSERKVAESSWFTFNPC